MKTNFLEVKFLNNQPILINISDIASIMRTKYNHQGKEVIHITMHNGKEYDVVEEYEEVKDLIELALEPQ